MKKFLSIIAVVTLSLSILSGCASSTPTPTPTPAATKTDTVTSASIVNNSAAFEKAISKNGTWIIAILKDVTTDKDLVLDGEFNNCLLYTSDAADDLLCVDLGGRGI